MRRPVECMAAASIAATWMSLVGCGRPWQPTAETVRAEPGRQIYAVGAYLPGRYPIHRHYELWDPRYPSGERVGYPRVGEADRRVEGIASPEKFDRLQTYYPRASGETGRDRPYPPFGKTGGGILEFDPSLAEFPERMGVGETFEARTRVKQFWANGFPAAEGELTRIVTLEGLESVDVKAGHFSDCLRLRVDMELKLGLATHLFSREHLWLSAGVGEVRRLLHVWGRSFLAWVDQPLEYGLVKVEEGPGRGQPQGPTPRRWWARVAILVGWRGLSPFPAGLVVENADGPGVASSSGGDTGTSQKTN